MSEKLGYMVAVAVLSTGLVAPQITSAGCGSCGPAAVKAPAKVCPASGSCKSGCGRAKAKACPKSCAKACCPKGAAKPETAEVDTHALATLLNAKAAVTLLDARSGKWDDGRRIPGAKGLSPAATAKEAAALIPSKDALVVTYCAGVKCPASRMLAATLKGLGYSNILESPAGIAGWAEHGNPIEQAK